MESVVCVPVPKNDLWTIQFFHKFEVSVLEKRETFTVEFPSPKFDTLGPHLAMEDRVIDGVVEKHQGKGSEKNVTPNRQRGT